MKDNRPSSRSRTHGAWHLAPVRDEPITVSPARLRYERYCLSETVVQVWGLPLASLPVQTAVCVLPSLEIDPLLVTETLPSFLPVASRCCGSGRVSDTMSASGLPVILHSLPSNLQVNSTDVGCPSGPTPFAV